MSPLWLLATALAVASVAGLGGATIARNYVYHDEKVMWQDVLAKRPDNARAMVNLGFIMASVDDNYGEALPMLERAVELKPRFGKARRHLGQVLIELGRSQDALVHLRESERMTPGDMETQYLLGCALSLLGNKNKRALAAFDKSLELHAKKYRSFNDKRIPKVHLNRGKTYGNMGKPALAEQEFRRALELDPEDYDSREALMMALGDQQKHGAEFFRLYKECLDEKPDAYWPRYKLIQMHLRKQDYKSAEPEVLELLRFVPPGHPFRDEVEKTLRFIRQKLNE